MATLERRLGPTPARVYTPERQLASPNHLVSSIVARDLGPDVSLQLFIEGRPTGGRIIISCGVERPLVQRLLNLEDIHEITSGPPMNGRGPSIEEVREPVTFDTALRTLQDLVWSIPDRVSRAIVRAPALGVTHTQERVGLLMTALDKAVNELADAAKELTERAGRPDQESAA